MKRKKIYFFTEFPFEKRDFLRFGFDIFKKNKFEVFVIDFTPIILSNYKDLNKSMKCAVGENYFLIEKKSDFYSLQNNFDNNSIVISLFKIKSNTRFIFEFLIERKLYFGFCNLNLVPSNDRLFMEKISYLFKNPKSLIKKADSLLTQYQNKNLNSIFPKFIILGGKKAILSNKYPKNNDTILIETHTLDYDLYLDEELKNGDKPIKQNYVVFLDEYVPFHPDYIHQNIEPYCKSDNYYPDLNSFFNEVEVKTGFEIVICAHPKAEYKKMGNLFDNRKILYNKTINSVKFSEFVITHASTSSNFAVLYKKPMIFVKSNKYDKSFNKIIDFHSSIFEESAIDISSKGEKYSGVKKINEKIYKSYKIDYIKNVNTPKKKVWNIFVEKLDILN